MNDQIQLELLKWAQDIKSFACQEIPLLAQEMVSYGYYLNLFGAIFFMVLALIFLLMVIGGFISKHDDSSSGFFGIVCFFFIVLAVFSACCIGTCMKTCYAPRLYVLDKITDKL